MLADRLMGVLIACCSGKYDGETKISHRGRRRDYSGAL